MKSLPALAHFKQDFAASIVVFLVALPLCMGIAIASGAPPAAGIITGIVGGIVVGAISGSPLQVSGPAAGLTVIAWQLIQEHGAEAFGLCVMVAGLLQFVAGALGGGRWFRAVSPAVVYGMLAGIGVLIFASQFHVLVDDKPQGSGIDNILSIPHAIAKSFDPTLQTTHARAAFLGVLTIAVIAVWSWARPEKLRFIPAPLVAVFVAVIAAAMMRADVSYVSVPDDLLSAAAFPTAATFERLLDWEIAGAVFGLAVVASAETLLCAGAVDRMQPHVKADYDRELRAQGVGNAICGFLGALPMTGVIVRSSANVESGARTRFSAILHGVWLLGLVLLIPGALRVVPTSSLAAVLVFTGYKLVNPAHIRQLRAYGWSSVGIFVATLVSIVVTDLLTGVIVGVVLSLVRLLWRLTHLEVNVTDRSDGSVHVELRGAATFVRVPELVTRLGKIAPDKEVHVHVEGLSFVDHASWEALGEWEEQHKRRGGRVVLEWHHLSGLSERVRAPSEARVDAAPAPRAVPH